MEYIKNIVEKFLDFIFGTKIGKFIFIVTPILFIDLIVLVIFEDTDIFLSILMGGVFSAIILSFSKSKNNINLK
jgi:hypothetical protein